MLRGATMAAALAIYEQALELAPKHPEAAAARNNLGAMRLAQGEKDAALEHFEAALAAAPANLESRYNAALLYLERGRSDEAIALLEQAAQLEPNHEPVNLRLGLAYLDAQRDGDAYRSLLLVRRLHPANWAAALGLAVLHARAEQPEPARQLLEAGLELGSDDARTFAGGFPILAPLLGD